MGKFVCRKGASAHLLKKWGVSYTASTLAKMATVDGGPPYRKVGRRVYYTVADLDRWLSEKTSDLTECSWEP